MRTSSPSITSVLLAIVSLGASLTQSTKATIALGPEGQLLGRFNVAQLSLVLDRGDSGRTIPQTALDWTNTICGGLKSARSHAHKDPAEVPVPIIPLNQASDRRPVHSSRRVHRRMERKTADWRFILESPFGKTCLPGESSFSLAFHHFPWSAQGEPTVPCLR